MDSWWFTTGEPENSGEEKKITIQQDKHTVCIRANGLDQKYFEMHLDEKTCPIKESSPMLWEEKNVRTKRQTIRHTKTNSMQFLLSFVQIELKQCVEFGINETFA